MGSIAIVLLLSHPSSLLREIAITYISLHWFSMVAETHRVWSIFNKSAFYAPVLLISTQEELQNKKGVQHEDYSWGNPS